mgnify:CR=1 FL=1|jgi:hypothetical protein
MLSTNANIICEAVVRNWKSEYSELEEEFKLKLSRKDFFNKVFPILGNRTINDYLKEEIKQLTGEVSSFKYPTFKKRAEILLTHSKILNLNFDILDESTILNGLQKVRGIKIKSVFDFLKADGKFNTEHWIYFLDKQGEINIDFSDHNELLSTLCYISNIISYYGILPFHVEKSDDGDSILFTCIDFLNEVSTFFVSITNPLASHFI